MRELDPEVRRILVLARAEAVACGSQVLGTSHVLLGILRSGNELSRHLAAMSVDLQSARALAKMGSQATHKSPDRKATPFSPRVVAALNSSAVGSAAHLTAAGLLRALLTQRGGALRVLKELGVSSQQLDSLGMASASGSQSLASVESNTSVDEACRHRGPNLAIERVWLAGHQEPPVEVVVCPTCGEIVSVLG